MKGQKNMNYKERIESLINYSREITDLHEQALNVEDSELRINLLEECVEAYRKHYIQALELWRNMMEESNEHFLKIESYAKVFEEYSNKLAKMLQRERKEYNEFLYNFCAVMIHDPRAGFEMVLKHIERKEKTENQSSDNINWTLEFGLLLRLKMAWKLIF
jgi:hypothetical protein